MIYLDNAATTRRKPLSVLLSATREMLFSANAGRGGHKASLRVALEVEKTRDIIKDCFFDGNVIFTKNCTEALNLAIVGSEPKKQVITTVFDHNSVLRPLKRLENEGKISLKILTPDKDGFAGPLLEALKKETSLVVMTARSNVNGMRTDVEKMARIVKERSHALFLADLAQSAGYEKLVYDDMDMIAAPGHKGLHGLQGTGFLLVRPNLSLSPIITGGTGTSSLSLTIPLEVPEGMEAGTLNAVGVISLRQGIEHVFHGMERREKRVSFLVTTMKKRLEKEEKVITYPSEGNVVLCNVKGRESAEVCDELSARYGICARGGLHCAPLMHAFLGTGKTGAIRFSFGEGNDLIQTIYASEMLKKIARSSK